MTRDPMEIIKQRNAEVERIRGYGDLTPEAKERRIAEVQTRAQAEYQEAIASREREIAQRVEKAEKELFRFRYPPLASEAEKAQLRALRRQAYDEVSFAATLSEHPIEIDEKLEGFLERAERTGDEELALAVFHIATEKGSRKVTDAYLAGRPQEKQRWEEYVAARGEAERSRGIEGMLERGLEAKAMEHGAYS
jgi:hypothetical protein